MGGNIQDILLAFWVLNNISILEFHYVCDRWPKNEMIFFPNAKTNNYNSKRKDLHFWISEGPLMRPIVLWVQAPAWLLLYLVKKQPVAVNWPIINITFWNDLSVISRILFLFYLSSSVLLTLHPFIPTYMHSFNSLNQV